MAYYLKGSGTDGEEGHGAHYYALSPTLNIAIYSEVFANIVLPPNDQYHWKNIPEPGTAEYERRNGYISMGINGIKNGDNYGVDLGIVNLGQGWMPYYYDVASRDYTDYSENFDDYIVDSSATHAIIVVKPFDSSHVGMYVQFKDTNGNDVGDPFDREDIPVNSRSSWNRFYRFASFVQDEEKTDPDVRTDSTFMLGGSFTNLGIYNETTSSYYPWGINTTSPAANIEKAWIMYFPKCQVSNITNTGESFSIDHWA